MVRLDEDSKNVLAQAAQLRRISVSDYVRAVTVGQARRGVASSQDRTLVLTPEEQLAFWRAIEAPAKPTSAQRGLGKLIGARAKDTASRNKPC